MKTITNNQPSTFTYQPIRRYEGSRANIFTSAFAGLYEIVMNSYGKEVNYPMSKLNGHPHLDGRGDIHHRMGGVLTVEEHDRYVEVTDTIRIANNKKYAN
jgi:hypothetical protein